MARIRAICAAHPNFVFDDELLTELEYLWYDLEPDERDVLNAEARRGNACD
jgi:hypothetical protein